MKKTSFALLAVLVSCTLAVGGMTAANAEEGTNPPPASGNTDAAKSSYTIRVSNVNHPKKLIRAGDSVKIVVKRVSGPIASDAKIKIRLSKAPIGSKQKNYFTRLGKAVDDLRFTAGKVTIKVTFDGADPIQRTISVR